MIRKHLVMWIVTLLLLAVGGVPLALASSSSPASLAAYATATPATTRVNASLATTSSASTTNTQSLTLETVYQNVNSSVVEVVSLAQASQFSNSSVEQGLGSGFVWDKQGDIVTNDHVVEGADALQVVFADGTRVDATLVGIDPSSDLAVIKVDPTLVNLVPVEQGDMSHVAVGQQVSAIGNPYGFQGTLTEGIVSGLGRTISSQTDYNIANAIQTDAAINPGNSGGPLLNMQGQVIGVNDQIESTSGSNSGVGFAIPISIVQRVVPALIENGSYQHAYLGISGATYSSTWSDALGFSKSAKGVYVMDVVQGGPAQQAALRGGSQNTSLLLDVTQRGPEYLQSGGDLITAIDGQPVTSMDGLMTYLSEHGSPGQAVKLTVLRSDGQQTTITVTLGVQPTQVADNLMAS